MKSPRVAAALSLLLGLGSIGLLVVTATRTFPRGLIVAGLFAAAFVALWEAIRRPGRPRAVFGVLAGLLVVGAVVVLLSGRVLVEAVAAGVLLGLCLVTSRLAFGVHAVLPVEPPPRKAVMIWNPRSGGGKALAAHLDDEARKRGIEPIELKPGDDLVELVRGAVAGGADGLAAAGGDGTQALVAAIAAEYHLPFACIPAGTRNHFALDLGVDRNDVVGALDAFVSGRERRVDLAEVNGRVFVNNVSLGLYAAAVQNAGYRDAKLRTILDTMPEFVGTATTESRDLRYPRPIAGKEGQPIVIMVSNNPYRLGYLIGSGTRPRLDTAQLGLAAMLAPAGNERRRPIWQQWTASTFRVDSEGPVPVGVDGEALMMDPPLRFTIRPGILRVRIAPHHPGASPSAAEPAGLLDGVRRLLRIVRTGDPTTA